MQQPGIERHVDVAVVGAGLSGLTAATALRRAGRSVVVLEARDRVGGKLWSPDVAGVPADLGAHWVGRSHRRVRQLASDLGLEIHPQRLVGKHVMDFGGHRRVTRHETPSTPVGGVLETGLRVAQLERMVRRIDRSAPWTSADAAALDAMTVADWMRRVRTDTARAALTLGLNTTSGKDPDEISMLAFLSYAKASRSLTAMLRFRRGAQDAHLPAGSQTLATKLAEPLTDAVELEAPVRSIRQDDGGVALDHDRGTVRASVVIVAHSPATVEAITFDPPLPDDRLRLQRSSPLGGYTKAILAYPEPWWRRKGLSGLGLADRGDVQMVVDVGPESGGPGLLAAFVTGSRARTFAALPDDEQRVRILEAVGALLGPETAAATEFQLVAWSEEPWSLGAPAGISTPGTLASAGAALRRPEGRVHWAGTETATAYPGYMEGAIVAGEAAAAAVLRSGQL